MISDSTDSHQVDHVRSKKSDFGILGPLFALPLGLFWCMQYIALNSSRQVCINPKIIHQKCIHQQFSTLILSHTYRCFIRAFIQIKNISNSDGIQLRNDDNVCVCSILCSACSIMSNFLFFPFSRLCCLLAICNMQLALDSCKTGATGIISIFMLHALHKILHTQTFSSFLS